MTTTTRGHTLSPSSSALLDAARPHTQHGQRYIRAVADAARDLMQADEHTEDTWARALRDALTRHSIRHPGSHMTPLTDYRYVRRAEDVYSAHPGDSPMSEVRRGAEPVLLHPGEGDPDQTRYVRHEGTPTVMQTTTRQLEQMRATPGGWPAETWPEVLVQALPRLTVAQARTLALLIDAGAGPIYGGRAVRWVTREGRPIARDRVAALLEAGLVEYDVTPGRPTMRITQQGHDTHAWYRGVVS